MRILRVISRLNTGGPTRHVLLLSEGLRSRGHETLLVYGAVAPGEASMEQMAAASGVPAVRVASLGRSLRAVHDVRALFRLVRIVFAIRPDVVHTHTSKAGMLGRLAAALYNGSRSRRRRCAVVHTFHGHVFEGYFSPAVGRAVLGIERLLARASDRIVTISPRQREDIVTRFRVAPDSKVAVIPLGLDLARLCDLTAASPTLREELRLDRHAVVVGFVGRLVPIKNPGLLVRAFARARARDPRLHLVVAGGGQLRPAIERLATDLHLEPAVRFLGWTDRLEELYATIDICALSSINEGTPVALIEALAAAKPVVATAVGGVPDVIADNVHGRLVPPGDTDALASALVELAADSALRARLGSAGRRRVAAAYAHPRLVTDVEALYERVLLERRSRVR